MYPSIITENFIFWDTFYSSPDGADAWRQPEEGHQLVNIAESLLHNHMTQPELSESVTSQAEISSCN